MSKTGAVIAICVVAVAIWIMLGGFTDARKRAVVNLLQPKAESGATVVEPGGTDSKSMEVLSALEAKYKTRKGGVQ